MLGSRQIAELSVEKLFLDALKEGLASLEAMQTSFSSAPLLPLQRSEFIELMTFASICNDLISDSDDEKQINWR